MNTPDKIPQDVQQQIDGVKAMVEQELSEENVQQSEAKAHYDRIMETLMQVTERLDEEAEKTERFLFNQAEFINALEHVKADQLSGLKKEKISPAEWATRFNRWFVFCDTVINMGISCRYPKESAKKEDYETIFQTLKLNKQFETTFLKPRGIRVEFKHKSKQVMDKYPWLAMPVLLITDEAGEEHQIAIIPSPNSQVWWLDILLNFHGTYDWNAIDPWDLQSADGAPRSTIDDPYMRHYQGDQEAPLLVEPEVQAPVAQEMHVEPEVSVPKRSIFTNVISFFRRLFKS